MSNIPPHRYATTHEAMTDLFHHVNQLALFSPFAGHFIASMKDGMHWVHLEGIPGTEGEGLDFGFEWDDIYKPKRIIIHGLMPWAGQNRGRYIFASYHKIGGVAARDMVDKITVSADKVVPQIAADIARRLLPSYKILVAEARRLIAENNDFNQKKLDAMRVVACKLRDRLPKPEEVDRNYRYGRDGLYATVNSATSIKLEIDCANAAQALDIITYVQALRKGALCDNRIGG